MGADDRIRQAFEQLAATLRTEFDVRANVLARELSATIEEERMAAEADALSRLASELAAARTEADARLTEARQQAAAEARAESTAELERLRRELAEARTALQQSDAALAAMRTAADGARSELASAKASAEDARAQLTAAQAAAEGLRAELAAARAADEEFRAEVATAREGTERTRTELAAAREALEQSRAAMASARAEADQARADAERARERADALAGESERALQRAVAAEDALQVARDRAATLEAKASEVPAAALAERHGRIAGLDRLASSLRRIGSAAALTEVLSALADAAAPETSRTAVLVSAVSPPDTFQAFRLTGFATVPNGPMPRSALADVSRGLPFAPLAAGRVGFAVPIEVGGQTVAFVYGDDAGEQRAAGAHDVPSAWPEALEILARHAALRLEVLTALRTVQALGGRGTSGLNAPVATMGAVNAAAASTEDDQSARRYARLLVSEIKLYNEDEVRAGRERRDLFERLRPAIERARRVYEERVPATVQQRAAYFDDEIVRILADGDPAALGGTESR
jgi:hypothetical protein